MDCVLPCVLIHKNIWIVNILEENFVIDYFIKNCCGFFATVFLMKATVTLSKNNGFLFIAQLKSQFYSRNADGIIERKIQKRCFERNGEVELPF